MNGRITFVRHAESESNAKKLIHGTSGKDVPLTDLGEDQALKTGEKLHKENFTAIYSSDYERALETACLIVKKSDYPIPPGGIRAWEGLRERDFGKLEGLPYTAMMQDARNQGCTKENVWSKYCPEGGETKEQLRIRARKVVEDLIVELTTSDYAEPNLLVTSHWMLLNEIVACLAEEKAAKMPCTETEWRTAGSSGSNASITQYTFKRKEGEKDWEIVCDVFSNVDHLK